MNEFLESSTYIDWAEPKVEGKARELTGSNTSDIAIAKSCFEWVRDEIKHSHDFGLNPVTAKASEVLRERTGYCYAKSHLLAALLRANRIPAGLCYQRLSVEGDGSPYCIHGLNAVFLKEYGWYRIDPRGNKEGVDAQFLPPTEILAFSTSLDEEYLDEEIYKSPLPSVIEALTLNKTEQEVWEHLPDF